MYSMELVDFTGSNRGPTHLKYDDDEWLFLVVFLIRIWRRFYLICGRVEEDYLGVREGHGDGDGSDDEGAADE